MSCMELTIRSDVCGEFRLQNVSVLTSGASGRIFVKRGVPVDVQQRVPNDVRGTCGLKEYRASVLRQPN